MCAIRRVMLVGHCGFDASEITNLVRSACPDLPIEDAYAADQVEAAGPDTLMLINRQLGYGFSVPSGIELIRKLAARPDAPVMMLVSNYDSAQREAVAAGARPGFGKSSLRDPQTRRLLQDAASGDAGTREAG